VNRVVVPCYLERDIATVIGRVPARFENFVSAGFPGRLAPVCQRLYRQYPAGTGGPQQLDEQQPDRPASDDRHAPAERNVP
jgi:hypothetical protein